MPVEKDTNPKDINLALTFYGGVSLAVYEAGVADELLRFLQFCRERKNEFGIPDINLKVIAGSSAGGLAGVMLAAAYINSDDPTEHIKKIRDMWLDVADFSTLQYKPGDNIRSLLNNDILEDKIREYLKIGSKDCKREKDITLKITGTNMQGLFDALPVEDDFVKVDSYAKKTIPTTRYTEIFTFNSDNISDAVEGGEDCEDITRASRVTSSFPAAFPPQKTQSPSFPKETIDSITNNSHSFWYCDGGVLANKPLGYAIDEIEESPVLGDWLFIFIDPEPDEDLQDQKKEEKKWDKDEIDPAETVGAFLSIKMAETIYYDLRRIQQINNQVMQINSVVPDIWSFLSSSNELSHASVDTLRKNVSASRLYRFLKEYIKCAATIRKYIHDKPQYKQRLDDLDNTQSEITTLIEPLNLIEKIDSLILKNKLKTLNLPFSTDQIVNQYNVIRYADGNPFSKYKDTVKEIKNAQLRFRQIAFWADDDYNNYNETIKDNTWDEYDKAADNLLGLVKVLKKIYIEIMDNLLKLFTAFDDPKSEEGSLYNKFECYMMVRESIHAAANVETRQLIDIVRVYHDNKENGRLAGALLAHFSAFLDKGWRKNDYLWGKLDARKALKSKLKTDGDKYIGFNDNFWAAYESGCNSNEDKYENKHRLDNSNKLSNTQLQLDELPASNIIPPVNGVLKTFGKLINKYENSLFFRIMDRLNVKTLLIPLRFFLWLVYQATAQPKCDASGGKLVTKFDEFISALKRYFGFFGIGVVTGIFLTYFGPETFKSIWHLIKGDFIPRLREYINDIITGILNNSVNLDNPLTKLMIHILSSVASFVLLVLLLLSALFIIIKVYNAVRRIMRLLSRTFR
ncbi:MAG: DUF3376 domain-containing protein [Candidatus Magnetominusculus sp. LBB02]|nr:DUF3376 domain-containing protein [Candidatus Magnetominusculus sp. LBB02]